MRNKTSITLIDKLTDWIVSQALDDPDLEQIVRGTCERLAAAGIPVSRIHMSFSVLHPLYHAMGFTWIRNEGITVDGYRHADTMGDRFTKSPYFYLINNGLRHMRRRIEDNDCLDFPIFEELHEQGYSDYLAFVRQFEIDTGKGMLGSWATKRPGGFSEDELAALMRIEKRLAVTAKIAVLRDLTSNALTTYLGEDAGKRVMDGQIQRGDGETIRAAIVMGDIRKSTQLAEELGRQAYIETLNSFFDNVAGAFSDAGGEILSFIGDGFLAIFPCNSNTKAAREKACRLAHKAALTASVRMHESNKQRIKNGDEPIGYGLGMHIGNVMFGNVGLETRLTFSVFGAAVNETARLEAYTKKFNHTVIASPEFRKRCKGEWQSLGKHALRGFEQHVELFGADTGIALKSGEQIPRCHREKSLSDAENVILLHQKTIEKRP